MVREVYKTAAEVRGTSLETLAGQIAENVDALFAAVSGVH
jgi:Tat protein secretion system quality control protein TatD with DNase activity